MYQSVEICSICVYQCANVLMGVLGAFVSSCEKEAFVFSCRKRMVLGVFLSEFSLVPC
jgi:hypothetical protein